MGTREVSARPWGGQPGETFHTLRSRWRTACLTAGWPFPNDWALAEVDHVCSVLLAGADLTAALGKLGRARARAGVGLAETLRDLAALHAVLTLPGAIVSPDPDATPAALLRVTALAWADVILEQLAHAEVADSLTGLSSPAYLRSRLHEVYREAAAAGRSASATHILVVLAPQPALTSGWSRLTVMVLLADALRAVFDGGQTLAAIGPTTLGVLAERDSGLTERLTRLRWSAAARLAVDPQLRAVDPPPVWLEELPASHLAACQLLAELART